MILDHEDLMVDAAIRDLGIAYVVKAAASAARAAGRLLEVLSPWPQGGKRWRFTRASRRVLGPAGILEIVMRSERPIEEIAGTRARVLERSAKTAVTQNLLHSLLSNARA